MRENNESILNLLNSLPDTLGDDAINKVKVDIANKIENEIGRCEDILKWQKNGVIGDGELTPEEQMAINKLTQAWEGFEEFVLNK